MTTTTTHTRPQRRPSRPRTQISQGHRFVNPRTGRFELVETTSADGVWTYERQMDQPGTPWWAIHNATGMVQAFGTIAAARQWTASPGSSVLLVSIAHDELGREGATSDKKTRARRAIAILTGQLAPAAAFPEPDALCVCGGYLAWTGHGLVHVDICAAERFSQPCEGEPHVFCGQPSAIQCEHTSCHADNNLTAEPCLIGHEACCGCCNERA